MGESGKSTVVANFNHTTTTSGRPYAVCLFFFMSPQKSCAVCTIILLVILVHDQSMLIHSPDVNIRSSVGRAFFYPINRDGMACLHEFYLLTHDCTFYVLSDSKLRDKIEYPLSGGTQ